MAAEAKEAEERAAAEKKAAEEAAAQAKEAADKAAAERAAKEEAKRNAARNQIASERAKAKQLIEKIKNTAEKSLGSVNKSSNNINSAYEEAITEAAKSNKALATYKKAESVAQANLNLAKDQLLALGNSLNIAAENQKKAISNFANAQIQVQEIKTEIDINKKQIAQLGEQIKVAEKAVSDLNKEYQEVSKVVTAALAKAEESKRIADLAYKALMSATNTSNLVTNGNDFSLANENAEIPSYSATPQALSKLKEQYQIAQNQADKDRLAADRAQSQAKVIREKLTSANLLLNEKLSQQQKLKSKQSQLEQQLKVAQESLKSAEALKTQAVAAYSKAENLLAQNRAKFRESELNYEAAKAKTKLEFENATSKNNQVLALQKLSEWSKKSVTLASGFISDIENDISRFDSNLALDFINQDVQVGFIQTSIPVLIFSIVAVVALYAYLKNRRRRSKISALDAEIIEQLRAKQIRSTQVKTKVKSKKKSVKK